ncbi:MAG: CPBP family intramembrane metalloprotease [Chloroflexota bacterium]|nr:CPBP family intramembrane metalloprotease [Chloroflexota bacterium]
MDDPRPDEAPSADDSQILGRYRVLQLISVAMIAAGLALPLAVLASNPRMLSSAQDLGDVQRLLLPLLLLALGGLLLIVGLVINAVRALIVRAALPPKRYRGPAIFVLLLLAVILGTIVSLGAAGTALALTNGDPLSPGGTLLLLTSTQIGLAVVAGGLVLAPGALAGLRVTPPSGLGRSILIGVGMAVPAWIGANVLAYLASLALEAIGVKPDNLILDTFLNNADPTVIVVAFVLVAPVAEELFFRGVVYNAWLRERGPRAAVVGSAALFAAIHASLYSLVPIFVLGVALALVYRSTRSLPASMAMHAGFNAISVGIALLARAGILSLPN